MDIHSYWDAVLRQDREALPGFFAPNAVINWHCSNERFTVEEFIRANCAYPGRWAGNIQRLEQMGELTICAVHVYSADGALSFHVVSFIRVKDGKINAVDEYWGDDSPAPQWRLDMGIGTIIEQEERK